MVECPFCADEKAELREAFNIGARTLESAVEQQAAAHGATQALIDNLRAYIKLVFPAEMTPHAKRILEDILDRHKVQQFDGPGAGGSMES